ncbi:MAG TPA: hypothetical protein VGN73_14450, partial [Gemmatimonadaceae bacterium]|nr:hypothetical protein [Gemmatimonadaceae bacterium]
MRAMKSESKSISQPSSIRSKPTTKRAIMRKGLLLAAVLFTVDASAQGRVQRPMTFEDFAAVKNVGDPQISP